MAGHRTRCKRSTTLVHPTYLSAGTSRGPNVSFSVRVEAERAPEEAFGMCQHVPINVALLFEMQSYPIVPMLMTSACWIRCAT